MSEVDREVEKVVAIGQKNRDVLPLIQNWCAHARVVVEGGVGLVEQATGLPIAMRRLTCQYERARGATSMHLAQNALDFHDRNCVGCTERQPVGLPNLTELLRERDEKARQEEAAQRSRETIERAALEKRSASRMSLRKNAPHMRVGVLEILDTLDRTSSQAAGEELIESARAVPEVFDSALRMQVVAVADAGGDARTDATLTTLELTGADARTLAEVALRALARGDAIERAGRIVAEHVSDATASGTDAPALLVGSAAQSLIWLARPIRSHFYKEGRPSQPAGLIAARRVAGEAIDIAVRKALRHTDKELRRAGAYAVAALMSAGDREAGRRFVNDLLAAFSQPDDIYYDGEASTTVAWVLSRALALYPEEVDQALSASLERGGQAERRGVLRSYAAVFDRDEEGRRPKADGTRDTGTPVERLAFERILGIVSRLPDDDDVLREASTFLEYARAIPWDLTQAAVPALLGTVALAADELTKAGRATKLEDPRPEELKALETMARRTLCSSVMNAAMKLVLRVATSHPSRIARDETIAAVLETLGSLPEAAERLKAELVSHLGVLGDRPATVALVLPLVYRALMDASQQVRAAGAEAYGRLARQAGSANLPSLVHETFLVLLTDPFVVVHRAALSALQEADLPDQFLDDAIRRVSYVVRAHSDGDRSDVLALALEVWLGLLRHTNRVTPAVQTVAVKLLRKLQPYDAKDFIRHGWGGLREATGYADFVVDLLEHPGTFDTSYDDLIEELGALPSVEIQRLGKRIVEAGMTISSREPWRSGECLQVLAEAKVWDAAKELAHRRVEACGNTRDFHSRRLDAELGEAIVKLESAAAEGVVDDVVRHAGRARELQHEIARDEEDNKDVRGLFAPTRRPSTDG